eukprot:PITA_15986
MGASLLRLQFHDCFVNGCDGSVLLDNSTTFTSEKYANPNNNSARGFELGGPWWAVRLGRRDSTTANFSGANTNIPPPTSNLSNLISLFQAQGLSKKEMVTLSGDHNIGQARCVSFRGHTYNDTDIDRTYSTLFSSRCPRTAGSGDNNLSPLDYVTPTIFDNNYYINLKCKKGLLHSDQQLFNGGSTGSQCWNYYTYMQTLS